MAEETEREAEPSFEQALGQLEQIVASLERGEPELTSALAKYENGVRLLTHCHRLLDQAEVSIALLTGVDEQGNPVAAAFDATATIVRESGSPAPADPDAPSNQSKKPPTPARASSGKMRGPSPDDANDSDEPPF
jgi:exodeoxyribonuclease VII small subunit